MLWHLRRIDAVTDRNRHSEAEPKSGGSTFGAAGLQYGKFGVFCE